MVAARRRGGRGRYPLQYGGPPVSDTRPHARTADVHPSRDGRCGGAERAWWAPAARPLRRPTRRVSSVSCGWCLVGAGFTASRERPGVLQVRPCIIWLIAATFFYCYFII